MSTIKEFRNFDQVSWGIRVTTDKILGLDILVGAYCYQNI